MFKEPLKDRILKMLDTFNEKFQVSKDMIEEHFSCNANALSERNIETLRNIFNSLNDGMSTRETWFSVPKKKKKPVSGLDKQQDAGLSEKEKEEILKSEKEGPK